MHNTAFCSLKDLAKIRQESHVLYERLELFLEQMDEDEVNMRVTTAATIGECRALISRLCEDIVEVYEGAIGND